ncbi:hypothetical protein [Shewanella baltica]|uniref:hypothetical protein n=1 Tax=Shewanella baltica TaxID=62322 RepID=UPI00217EDFE7|nr:hypothetical protein [Shewanella baltica]MCS6241452.1 hypothetical protein [Shewanella baltica]
MRIGTYDNPLKLVREGAPRELLLKHSRHTSRGVFDFHKLDDFGSNTYILNVLFNNHLTLQDVKLALYFYEELADGGRLFSTSSGNFRPANEYGEGFHTQDTYEEGLVIGTDESFEQDFIRTNKSGYFPSLLHLTTSMGMNLTPQGITKLIRRLHDFGYITVTDVTPANTYNPPVTGKKTKYRARLRHIRLCKGMCQKDISGRWISRMKKKREVKKKDTAVQG